ncbi:hypothetical protein A1O7_00085 [Cladophialophora yegresii CBS 114405]|uniref:Uncharacterized protein n=1 Tax=Cladophialophora yegresii CBS 114405 TaxID=1182544 RepID=W9WFH0_9EURO|nr:uncharacterized protein A1O7_00085 [Cladophialophora yegresii CBS 114405]EXJ63750.1 hypothetical protein A1O7_00085 [Cladophialophora yegresii CBS 114405]
MKVVATTVPGGIVSRALRHWKLGDWETQQQSVGQTRFLEDLIQAAYLLTHLFCYRFLYHTVSTRLFSAALIPPLLLQIRVLIFPNNSLGPPPPPPPSPEEARQIRSKAASDILSLIPQPIARTFFAVHGDGTTEMIREEIEERLLGWTDDGEMNMYLVYAILEYVVLKLVPEMKDKTPSELLAERGVDILDFDIREAEREGARG